MKNVYINQDIDEPKYLFHGSPIKLDIIKPHQSSDSKFNIINVDNAVFLTPIFIQATAYAFKDTIKENSNNLKWNFEITNNNIIPIMKMENVIVDNSIIGYIYVFEINKKMIKDKNSYQYRCYEELIPIDVVEVCYKDYSKYYFVKNDNL